MYILQAFSWRKIKIKSSTLKGQEDESYVLWVQSTALEIQNNSFRLYSVTGSEPQSTE